LGGVAEWIFRKGAQILLAISSEAAKRLAEKEKP